MAADMLWSYDKSANLPPITELSAWEWEVLVAVKSASSKIELEMSEAPAEKNEIGLGKTAPDSPLARAFLPQETPPEDV